MNFNQFFFSSQFHVYDLANCFFFVWNSQTFHITIMISLDLGAQLQKEYKNVKYDSLKKLNAHLSVTPI